MKGYGEYTRGFVWSSKAWYHQLTAIEEEIWFGLYHPEGKTSGEMCMVWKELSEQRVPQLQVYDDAWSTLPRFADLLEKMGEMDKKHITQEQFIEMLTSCGFEDQTQYTRPGSR